MHFLFTLVCVQISAFHVYKAASLLFVDCHYQEEIEVTQEVAGSNEARVKSSFPGNIFILEYFFLYVERESDDVIVYSKSIDVVNRDDVVNGLEPMVRYSVTIATQDVNKYAGKFSMNIMWSWSECAV